MKRPNKEVTSARVASAAAKVLANPKSSRLEKEAAASALTQRPDHARRDNKETTSRRVASAAAKVLANPKSGRAAKSAAGSALTQRSGRR